MSGIEHAAEGQHGQRPRVFAQALLQAHERPGGIIHVGRMVLQADAEVALREADVVETTGVGQTCGDAPGLVAVDRARHAFVARHLQANDEVVAASGTDARHDLAHKAGASFEVTAVFVVAHIRPRRQKLGDQVAVTTMQFDAREAGTLEGLCRIHEGGDDAAHFVAAHHMRHRPAIGIRQGRHTDRRLHRIPQRLAADMPQLAEQPAVVAFHRLRQLLQTFKIGGIEYRHDAGRGHARRMHRQSLGDKHGRAAFGARGVEVDHARGDTMVLRVHRHHGRKHDAVLEPLAAQLERGEQHAWTPERARRGRG